MSTNIADLVWTATGGSTGRTNEDRHADVINVKDWGAVGDGVHDDRTNIQALINYAQSGIVAGDGQRYAKAAIYFPPGNYRIHTNSASGAAGQGILVINWDGSGHPQRSIVMFGDNSATTRIFYDGPLSSGGGGGNDILLALDNDIYGAYIRGLHFDMTPATGGGITAPGTWNTMCMWDRGRINNAGSNNLFRDLKFSGATFGLGFSGEGAAQGAENVLLYCKAYDCWKGFITFSHNALDETVIGGYVRNCRTGIVGSTGGFVTCIGVDFSANGPFNGATDYMGDFSSQGNQPGLVIGCVSKSQDFIPFANGCNYIAANYHTNASEGLFFRLLSSPACIDGNWSTNGIFTGQSAGPILEPDRRMYLKGNVFDNANVLTGWSGANGLNQNI